uniref:Putative rrm motif-containing protein n=1 Tax=Corethrella appendiculata TaxID=1370023 RepID=U5EYF8_9DIPT
MDVMELSLDEIIKKKKTSVNGTNGSIKRSNTLKSVRNNHQAAKVTRKPQPVQQQRSRNQITDARMKIIERNRTKIRDARDKLIEIARHSGDARLRLLKRSGGASKGGLTTRSLRNKDQMDVDIKADDLPKGTLLRRTVKNDIAYVTSTMPPLPTFSRTVQSVQPRHGSPPPIYSDPFDCYEVPVRRPIEKAPPAPIIQRQLRNHDIIIDDDDDLPPQPRRGILRSSHYEESRPHLSNSMRARLESAPNPNESMGIFARDLTPPPSSYRIVVSNLHESVTQTDIKELFEDIGDLLEARLVRPGVAEVIFRTLKDAEAAVDTYHNRQLDGQPMKCLLVKPRSSNKPTAPAIKYSSSQFSRLISSKTTSALKKQPLDIDIDVLHKALFKR